MQRHMRGPFHSHSLTAVSLFSLHSWISMSPAFRKGQGRASSRSACGVLGARAAGWAQLPGEPRGRRGQDGDGSSCQAPAESSELTGEEKKLF